MFEEPPEPEPYEPEPEPYEPEPVAEPEAVYEPPPERDPDSEAIDSSSRAARVSRRWGGRYSQEDAASETEASHAEVSAAYHDARDAAYHDAQRDQEHADWTAPGRPARWWWPPDWRRRPRD